MAFSTTILAFTVLAVLQLTASVPMYQNKAVQEAEIIALEQSNFIVPVEPLVNKIIRDLRAIRSQYKEIQDVTIKRKWIPGEVFVRGRISDEQINKIDTSVYGPLVDVKQFGYGSVLVFTKSYHPEVLSQRLQEKFNVKAEPNRSTPNGNGFIKYNARDNVYVIEKGPIFNFPGYRSGYHYEFLVNGDNVKLLKREVPASKV